MNSFFRKVASPLVSSIFRKGVSGLTSLFKKAPTLTQFSTGVRKASSVADKITNNPIVEQLAREQGFGDTFNLAKKGAGKLNQVADLSESGVRLQQKARDLRQGVRDKEDSGNILEKIKAIKNEAQDIQSKFV